MSNAFKRSFSKLTKAVNMQKQVATSKEVANCFLSDEAYNLLETLPYSASLHNRNGDAVWLSKKSQHLFQSDEDNLIGSKFFEGANPQDKLDILKAFSDCNISGKEQTVNFRRQQIGETDKLEAHQFELLISHYLNQNDNASYFLALVKDVTREQNAYEDTKQEIQNAKDSNSTKSLFLSNMSHELRTPLNAVVGFSQMLMGEAAVVLSEDKKIEYAGLIHDSANHLLNIINDLLDLSKIEAGKFQIIPEVFDLYQELKSTIDIMEPIAKQADVSLEYYVPDEIPKIFADSRAVRQILINLIANAIKFSNKTENVNVKLTRNLRKVRIDVSDTGLGMQQETIDQLGQMFFQAEQTASRRYEGTGLGLSIVAGLVSLHSGKLSFKSTPNKGTTVSVELPISSEQAAPIPSNPNDEIVFINEAKEPNLLRRLETISNICKTG